MNKLVLASILLLTTGLLVLKHHNLLPFKYKKNSLKFNAQYDSPNSPAASLRSSLNTLTEVNEKWNFWKNRFNK